MSDTAAAQTATIVRLTLEVGGMRTDLQALVQGLSLMLETQAAQSEMLQHLLEAASQDGPNENPMEGLVRQMTAAFARLTEAQHDTQREVARLGERIAAAIIRGAGAPAET